MIQVLNCSQRQPGRGSGGGWDGISHFLLCTFLISSIFYIVEKHLCSIRRKGCEQTGRLLYGSLRAASEYRHGTVPQLSKGEAPRSHWTPGVWGRERRGVFLPRQGREGQKPGGKRRRTVAVAASPLATSPSIPRLQPSWPQASAEPREKAPTFTWSTWHVTESFCSAFFSPIRKSCLNLEYAVWTSCRDRKLLDRSSVLTVS